MPFQFLNTRRRIFITAILYSFLVLIFEEQQFLLGQSQTLLILNLLQQGARSWVGLLSPALVITAFVLLVWFSFSLPPLGRAAAAALIAIVYLIQFSYWGLFHRFVSAIDMATALNSPPELWQLTIQSFIRWQGLLPALGYALFAAAAGRGGRPKTALPLTAAGLLLFNFVLCSLTGLNNPGNAFFQFFNETAKWVLNASPVEPRSLLRAPAGLQPPQNNVVLIIDESVRSDHLSINGYARPTTPYLEALAAGGSLYNWGQAASGATCSVPSNAALLTGVVITPQNFNKALELTNTLPTVFQYARQAGYRTHYIDAQQDYLWTGLNSQDLTFIDEWVRASQLGGSLERDFKAADLIRKITSTSTGNFIVLNKRGVHFIYSDNYPAEKSIWQPVPAENDFSQQHPDWVINAYDNAVHYNLENFFQRLIPKVDDPDFFAHTTILYTSDHGQTLFEHGEEWLHCNYTHNEANVPILLIGDLKTRPNLSFPASHSNLLPTLLQLMSVPAANQFTPYAASLLDPALPSFQKRYYLSGNSWLIDFDSGEAFPLP